ncbi:hypothetical protein PRUPE_5G141500 [Prunus persica]|uniref:Uncharacterized protein n=1 Tax=Prunus persica TaxID=3760 RepID=A0A251P8B3_PRUPE|nr:hypothetical protein PRUPE_5G141500 [Prunus persica]
MKYLYYPFNIKFELISTISKLISRPPVSHLHLQPQFSVFVIPPQFLFNLIILSFVGGLSWATDDDALERAFSLLIINDREIGRSRDFSFVTFRAGPWSEQLGPSPGAHN